MAQFADRQGVLDWLKAHEGQRVRLGDAASTLRVVARAEPVETLDACSTEFKAVHLRVDLPGLELDATLQDEALTLMVRAAPEQDGPALLVLPFAIPYGRLRMAPADAPEQRRAGTASPDAKAADEPEFSPYELLHRPRSD